MRKFEQDKFIEEKSVKFSMEITKTLEEMAITPWWHFRKLALAYGKIRGLQLATRILQDNINWEKFLTAIK